MKTIATSLPGCLIVEPRVFGDHRGFFYEAFNVERQFTQQAFSVAQINVSRSARGVLRGMHFQSPQPQGKLVWVVEGEVFDVAADINPNSPTYGQWEGTLLSAQNQRQFYIPEGYAHGFQVLSEHATFCYTCSSPYRAEFDRAVAHNDPELNIEWPLPHLAQLSDKDRDAPTLEQLALALRSNHENFAPRR